MHRSISKPLRDGCSKTRPHPFPALVANLSHALSSLRVYGVRRATSVFWRGVQNLDLRDEFKERGVRYLPSLRTETPFHETSQHSPRLAWQGTELAPMSTSASRTVAFEHAMGSGARHPLLLRFMDPGCDISFLSSAQSSLRRLWFSSKLTLLSAWCAPLEQFSLTNRSLSTHREPI